MKLVSPPTARAIPTAWWSIHKSTPWFVQFNVNKLSSIDPTTMAVKEYTLPNPETRPRRIAITPDDVIW